MGPLAGLSLGRVLTRGSVVSILVSTPVPMCSVLTAGGGVDDDGGAAECGIALVAESLSTLIDASARGLEGPQAAAERHAAKNSGPNGQLVGRLNVWRLMGHPGEGL
jgi:hypothetical protein